MSTLARYLVKAYPPSFRDRYGAELDALVDDTGTSARTVVDLAVGAARAWARPRFTTADRLRARLGASAATVWVAWCAAFLVIPAIDKAVLDPPTPGAGGTVRVLLAVAFALFLLGWALAVGGALPVIVRSVAPAVRARQWQALRPLTPAIVLGAVEAIGLLVLGVVRAGDSAHSADRFGIVLWLVGLAGFVIALAVGPAECLRRLNPAVEPLRIAAVTGLLLALTLTAATACCLAAVAVSGDAALIGSQALAWVAIATGAVCSVVALTSSVRGLRALAARG